MAGRYLLDTNVAIALLRNEGSIVHRLLPGHEHFLNVVVLGELF